MKTLVFLAICLLMTSCNGFCYESIKVLEGDTCDSIGSIYSVSPADLMNYTPGLDCSNLQVGEDVCLYDPDLIGGNSSSGEVDASSSTNVEEQNVSGDEEQQAPIEEEQNSSGAEEQNPSEEQQNSSEEEQNPSEEQQNPGEEEQNPAEEEQVSNVEEQNASEEEQNIGEEEEQILDPFAEEVINAHQFYRDSFGSPRLIWNYTLNASAYAWAQSNAENRTMVHSIDQGAFSLYGENIAASSYSFYNSSGTFPIVFPPTNYVDGWASEWQMFVNGSVIFDNTCSTTGNWGDVAHFTQVIWKNSTSVGCGMATNFDYRVLVCQYYPSGNRVNEPIY